MAVIGINIVVLIMLFGVYSKLGELSTAIKRLNKQSAAATLPKAAAEPTPGPSAARSQDSLNDENGAPK